MMNGQCSLKSQRIFGDIGSSYYPSRLLLMSKHIGLNMSSLVQIE
jgi:hypothetical protein